MIKNVPPVGKVGGATYYTSSGDGVKPPQDAVNFASEPSREAILLEIDHYLTHLDFKRGSDPSGSADP